MKRIAKAAAVASLALLVLLRLPCALAQAAGAADWTMTVGQMKEAQGLAPDADLNTYSAGDCIQYAFPLPPDGDGLAGNVYYIFMADQLVMVGHSCDLYEMPEGTVLGEVFGGQLNRLRGMYGEPGIGEKQRLIRLLDTLGGNPLAKEDLTLFAGWELGNGTELYLFNVYGDSVLYLYTYSAKLFEE